MKPFAYYCSRVCKNIFKPGAQASGIDVVRTLFNLYEVSC